MTSAGPTLRQLARHRAPGGAAAISVRALFDDGKALRLRSRPLSLSVLTQNMGLLVAPAPYLGTDREGAIDEVTRRILALSPAVVGLCEVFSDGEREQIGSRLEPMYPFYREGPDEADFESDGGLMLLSKQPFVASHDKVYRDCDGWDCFANKGVLHVRVQPAGSPTPFDVFYTHAQDISTGDGARVLYRQLSALNHFVDAHRDPAVPCLIMGDINIPAEDPRHYAEMLERLSRPADLWTVTGGTAAQGVTYSPESTFYADAEDIPTHGQRLDYVLLRPGSRFTPIAERCEVLRFTRDGRHVSDHFGVWAEFAWAVESSS